MRQGLTRDLKRIGKKVDDIWTKIGGPDIEEIQTIPAQPGNEANPTSLEVDNVIPDDKEAAAEDEPQQQADAEKPADAPEDQDQ